MFRLCPGLLGYIIANSVCWLEVQLLVSQMRELACNSWQFYKAQKCFSMAAINILKTMTKLHLENVVKSSSE